jgi:hypothetical protein
VAEQTLAEKTWGHPIFVGWTTDGYRFYYCECGTIWRVKGENEEIMNLDGDVVDLLKICKEHNAYPFDAKMPEKVLSRFHNALEVALAMADEERATDSTES